MAKRTLELINRNYVFFLIFVAALSYGQILWMQPWQDDNALFFKLAHIEEPAGFIGRGPFGEGVYKYAITPFIPIYKLFGYYIPAYFALALVLYIIATLVIYKSLSFVLGEKAGRIASFIYASGYVISDGVWRLANSVTTSISIIFANLFLICYWQYNKKGKILWYILALLIFLAGLEFSLSRMHYFVAVAVLFEIIFLTFKKPLKSVFYSAIRLLPFLILFKLRVLGSDSRSGAVGNLALPGFLSSLTNLIIPDWLTNYFFKSSSHQIFINILAITIFILGLIALWKLHKEKRKLFLFFSLWILANLYAYSSYLPSVIFGTTDRYLAHSFFALTGIFAILFISFDKKRLSGRVGILIIILLGAGNLFNGFALQANILKTRSLPVKNFYETFKTYQPSINKGDVLYFDISKDKGEVYKDAISAAMMPDSTSFAWRYGVDRYDFSLVSDFGQLEELVKKENNDSQTIHSYWLGTTGLFDTTDDIRNYFSNKIGLSGGLDADISAKASLSMVPNGTSWSGADLVVNLEKPIRSTVPVNLELTLNAEPISVNDITFPLFYAGSEPPASSPWRNDLQKRLSLEYKREMQDFIARSLFEVNTEWRDNSVANIYDDDPDTFWQSDRVLWQKHEDFIIVKLDKIQSINRVAWMNASYKASIPVEYDVEVSLDGISWKIVKKISNGKIPIGQEFQVVSFAPVQARFVKTIISQTLGDDSPMISEFRVIPASLSLLDIHQAESFLSNPFLYIPNEEAFKSTTSSFGSKGEAAVYWMLDEEDSWRVSKDSKVKVVYDGRMHAYSIKIPAGGIKISKIKIADIKIPGTLTLSKINYNALNFKENNQ